MKSDHQIVERLLELKVRLRNASDACEGAGDVRALRTVIARLEGAIGVLEWVLREGNS